MLLDDEDGTNELRRYYAPYLELARDQGVGLVLESPTWRASPRWAAELGYGEGDLDVLNRKSIALMEELRDDLDVAAAPVVISGCVGPHDDGYSPATKLTAAAAQAYHSTQVATFCDTAADMVTAITMTYVDEAVGVRRLRPNSGSIPRSDPVRYDAAVPADLEERLRDVGLRVTAPRVAVLRALAESSDHPRVDQVIERVREAGISISTQAAYDVCEALNRAGLAQRIEFAGGPIRYEARAGDNHHHMVCRRCGVTVDVDCAVARRPCLEPDDAHGFAIDEASVTYWGTCPECQRTNESASA